MRNLPEDEPPDSQLMRLDNMLIAEGRSLGVENYVKKTLIFYFQASLDLNELVDLHHQQLVLMLLLV